MIFVISRQSSNRDLARTVLLLFGLNDLEIETAFNGDIPVGNID